jgi:hypothetical protein
MNELNLIINNGKDKPDDESTDLSSDGYIFYAKKDLDSLEFHIVVKKTDFSKNKAAHFTIIASTK